MKIKSIDINAFRGIPRRNLDLQGKSLLLQGENGTGKSSIVDAVEFFFTGRISHLPSNTSSYLKDYACHVNFKPEDMKISMDFDPGAVHVERGINSSSIPASMKGEFKTTSKVSFILRRSQILQFINNTPGERYKFIGEILNINGLEETEKGMINAQKKFQENFKGINEKLQENRDNLREILKEDVLREDVLNSLNEILKNEGMDTLNSADEIKDRAVKLMQSVENAEKKSADTLNDICAKVNEIISTAHYTRGTLKSAEDLRSEIIEMHGKEDISILDLLKKARDIINEKSRKCPLCQGEVSGFEILKSIDERLNNLKTLESKNKELKGLLDGINEDVKVLISNLRELISESSLFKELGKFREGLTHRLNCLSESAKLQSFLEGGTPKEVYKGLDLETILTTLKESSEKLKGPLRPSEESERSSKMAGLLFEVYKNIREFDEIDENLKSSKASLRIAEKIASTFSEVKKRKIQEVYDTIEGDLEHFYKILHPDDPHENINLNLNRRRRASTDLKMTIFGRENEDPRALSSEGHLDSLGLCIFLSIFKKFSSNFPLLVLDDVVTTVDSKHRETSVNSYLRSLRINNS